MSATGFADPLPQPSLQKEPVKVEAGLALAIQKTQREFEVTKSSFRALQGAQYGLKLDASTAALRLESGKAAFGVKLTTFGRGQKVVPIGLATSATSKDSEGWPQVKFIRDTVSEKFVNEAQGLHHWFQVNQRLAGSSNLTLKLQVSGAEALRKSGENAVEVSVKGLRFQYSGLKVWDAKGRELEARMEAVPENSQIALVVNDSEATYPVTIDPTWTQEAKLTASDKAATDNFGWSVSLSGDRALVGAHVSDPGGTSGAGAAYVFARASDGTWTQEAKLTASDKAVDDQFGYSVSISGDRALVGAPLSDPGGTSNTGAAYVFTRASDGTWTQEAKLMANDKAADDNFGYSVSLSGDRALVGAPLSDPGGLSLAGAAYVFTRASNGTWTQEVKLTASDKAAGDHFGWPVSLSGVRALVGARLSDPGGTTDAGSSYVYTVSYGTLFVSFPTLHLYGGVPGFYGGLTRANAGTVTVSEAAPTGGLTVNLSAPGTTIPSSVTIPAGATTATFDVSANQVVSETVATVTASATGYTNGSASVKVLANTVFATHFPQKEVNSSSSITGTLKLWVPAVTDFTATLSSSNPSALSVPSTVVVPAGASQVTFTATAGAVNADTVVTVSAGPANEPSGVKVYLITVKPSRELASVAVSPIHYGRTGTGRVELSAPAPVGGQVVALKSNRGNVTVPATVLVPEGETGANFTVTSTGTVATSATITATVGKVSKTATVTVVQPALASVTLTPASVVGGNSSTFQVTLTAAAPQGGVVVSLTASNGFAMGLPSTVTIPEGETVANVTVNTAAHTSATARTVTLKALVSRNRSVRTAILTITRN